MLSPNNERQWINPSKRLVDSAIARWNGNNLRADNTSVVTVMLDPPGPPRAQVNVIDTLSLKKFCSNCSTYDIDV